MGPLLEGLHAHVGDLFGEFISFFFAAGSVLYRNVVWVVLVIGLLLGVIGVTKRTAFRTWPVESNFEKYPAAPAINIDDVPSSSSSCPTSDDPSDSSSSDESSVLCDRDDSKWW